MASEFKQFLDSMRVENPIMVEAVSQAYDAIYEGAWDSIKEFGKAMKDFAYDYVGAKKGNSSSSAPSINIDSSKLENFKAKAKSAARHAGTAIGTTGAALALAACAGNANLHTNPDDYAASLKAKYGTEIHMDDRMSNEEMNTLAKNLVEKMRSEIPDAEDCNIENTAAWHDAVNITTAIYAIDQSQGDNLSQLINNKIKYNLKVDAKDIRNTDSDDVHAKKNKEKAVVEPTVTQDEDGNYIYGATTEKNGSNPSISYSNMQHPDNSNSQSTFTKTNNFDTKTGKFEV